jgi:hypothetical protein
MTLRVTVMKFMKFNPYPVLLTIGTLMLATVVFSQMESLASALKMRAVAATAESSDPDVAKHPDTRVVSVDGDRGQSL